MIKYLKNIFVGLYRLMQGMWISLKNMLRKKVTEPYPENRGKYVYFERGRGVLIMPHDANNEHACTGCKICEMNCPNGTIQVQVKKELDPETGKEKRVLDRHLYNVGSCTFCMLCTISCPSKAIAWSTDFENSVFSEKKLHMQLNKEGSRLRKKEKDNGNS